MSMAFEEVMSKSRIDDGEEHCHILFVVTNYVWGGPAEHHYSFCTKREMVATEIDRLLEVFVEEAKRVALEEVKPYQFLLIDALDENGRRMSGLNREIMLKDLLDFDDPDERQVQEHDHSTPGQRYKLYAFLCDEEFECSSNVPLIFDCTPKKFYDIMQQAVTAVLLSMRGEKEPGTKLNFIISLIDEEEGRIVDQSRTTAIAV
jgi:hypothetical protein